MSELSIPAPARFAVPSLSLAGLLAALLAIAAALAMDAAALLRSVNTMLIVPGGVTLALPPLTL